MTAWKQEQDIVVIPASPIYRYYEESGLLYDVAGNTYDYAVFDTGNNSNLLWDTTNEPESAWLG